MGLTRHYLLVNLVNSCEVPQGRDRGAAMTDTVNLYEAKTNLSKLVDRAAAGEEIIIAKAGKPKAKLVPYRTGKKRRGGQNLMGITYIAEDFDAPLPPEIQKYFE
jgi:prevent-host-death family protein